MLTLGSGVSFYAHGASQPVAQEKPAEEEANKWDVSNPPGTWRNISINTDSTTWSFVDVSPNGKTIIFDMLGDIYTLPIKGGVARALTAGIAWNFQPSFSPDGSKIAFISDRGGKDNIWIMNADGSEPQQVSKETEHLIHNPAWSPDGQWIAARKGFVSRRSIAAGEIWMYHVDGGSGLQLVERPNGEDAQKSMGEPAYSPDGRYLYYSQDATSGRVWRYNKDSTGQIFVIKRLDLEKNQSLTLTGGPGGAIRPVPSPDGRSLAFVKRLPNLSSAIFIKDLASGNEKLVFDKLERDLQESAGSHGNIPAFDWTPDGKHLVFWSAGKIHKLNVSNRKLITLNNRVTVSKKVRETLRYPVDVAPDEFRVKMLRWGQVTPGERGAIFQALGHLYRKIGDAEPRRLTQQTEDFEFWPRLSRDGKKLVYTTWNDQSLGRVRVVSSRGGRGKVIVDQPGHYVEPSFSPDGKWVVYRKITGGYLLSPLSSAEPGIYMVPARGGKPIKITDRGVQPQFSADGKRIYFSDSVDRDQALVSVDLAGLDRRVHAKGKKITNFSVSPDGRWLAFTEHFNAYIAPLTATAKPMVLGRSNTSVPVKQVSKRAGDFLAWSADSKALYWTNGATLYSRQVKDAFQFMNGTDSELPEPVATGLDLSFRHPADKPDSLIALVGAKVITMRDADQAQHAIDNGVVLVENNRISAVGKQGEVQIPANAKVLDTRGKTIIPGLIDTHAHGGMGTNEITPQQNWMQYSNLAFGVTTIHDPSNDTTEIFAHAELQKAGQILGPRTYSTGTILYGALSPAHSSEVESLEQAEFHVRRLKEAGAIAVKSYNQLGRDSRQQIIAAAAAMDIMVVPEGGMKFQHNLTHVVDGHTSVEHALPLVDVYDDVKQLWSQTATGYSPTFGVCYGGIMGENYWYDRSDVWRNPRLMRYSPKQFVEPRSMRRVRAPDAHYNHFNVAKTAKALNTLGVPVLIGAHGQREGLAAHWEMWMMHQGGFSPWEAIRGATFDAAKHLGMDKDLGSIEVGKLADLVVIDGDPTENLRRSEYVSYTMINGRLYDVSSMNEIHTGSRQRQAFYFEQPGGNLVPTATAEAIMNKASKHHWVH
ncbi:MAG: amidohydrolase family protein [Cellvibrionaceae bacterium]|nr:amidohydrolase family protein [Cellvibrionaceae bacterium]